MYVHANAKLGLAGRLCAGASDRGGDVVGGEGGGVQCLAGDRAPRVASLVGRWPRADGAAGSLESATPLAPAARPRAAGADLRLPSQDGLGSARLVAGATGLAHSTVWKVLKRAGLSPRPSTVKEPANSFEWPCPGDLLHMDVSRYARPGRGKCRRPC